MAMVDYAALAQQLRTDAGSGRYARHAQRVNDREAQGSIAASIARPLAQAGGMYVGKTILPGLLSSSAAPATPTVLGASWLGSGAAGAGAAGTAAGGAGMGATLGAALPWLGGAAALGAAGYLAYDQLSKPTKSKEQRMRDDLRSQFQDMGIANQDYQVGLRNGGSYDIGKDGHSTLVNQDGSKRRAWDADFTNANTGSIVGAVDPLAEIASARAGKEGIAREQAAGMLTNAVMSGDDAMSNARKLYTEAGLDRDSSATAIHHLFEQGRIDERRRDAYLASIDRLYGVANV